MASLWYITDRKGESNVLSNNPDTILRSGACHGKNLQVVGNYYSKTQTQRMHRVRFGSQHMKDEQRIPLN